MQIFFDLNVFLIVNTLSKEFILMSLRVGRCLQMENKMSVS